MNSLLAFGFVIAFATSARSELVFEKTEIDLHPAVGDEKAVAKFPYQNKGDKPLAIKSVTTSCGCTAASAKQTAEPGEKGEVTATFTIGDRMGTQQKAITVTTDDPTKPVTTLMMKIFIPQILELQPVFLAWQPGEAAKAKTIVAKSGKDTGIKDIDVQSSSPDFTAKVKPGSNAGEFDIQIEPKQTAQPVNATLTIRSTLPNGKVKVFYASARVMPPPPSLMQPVPTQSPKPNAGSAMVPAPVPVATSGSSAVKLDACSLLTSKDVESVQGEKVKDSKSSGRNSAGLAVSQCYFSLPTSSNSISLTVTQKSDTPDARDAKALWAETFHVEKKQERERGENEGKASTPEKLDGIGDEAFWLANRFGGELYVLKGEKFVRISVGGTADQAAKIDKSKKLAQIVLTRL